MHWIAPDSVPAISGHFERFLFNAHGEADGMILTNGAEVHFPPHLTKAVRAAVEKNRDGALRIYGVRPREGDVFAAIAIETVDGIRIVDDGPPKKHEREKHSQHRAKRARRRPMSAEGVVRRALHGPKGETRGVLLEDGRIIRFPPHEAPRLKALVRNGAEIAARGEGVETSMGAVIEAREIGPSPDDLRGVNAKPDKPDKAHEHKHGKPHGHKHDKPHDHEKHA